MNKLTSTLLLCALLLALLGGGLFLYNNLSDQMPAQTLAPSPEETTEPGSVESSGEDTSESVKTLAPDFTVVDGDGNEVTLWAQQGKPVVLNFWASWCSPCKSEMPDFEAAYQTYGEDITFMMVNLTDGSRETVETASDFIAGQGYTFPVYFDTNYSAAIAYGASAIPITFFIGADGSPVAYGQGALSAETLQTGIDMLLDP